MGEVDGAEGEALGGELFKAAFEVAPGPVEAFEGGDVSLAAPPDREVERQIRLGAVLGPKATMRAPGRQALITCSSTAGERTRSWATKNSAASAPGSTVHWRV
jgi:hypothetical protein